MDEIENTKSFWQAKQECTYGIQCHINQTKRNKALNEKFFGDDTGMQFWRGFVQNGSFMSGDGLCLCGFPIKTGQIFIRGSVLCNIGSECAKRYINQFELLTGDFDSLKLLKDDVKKFLQSQPKYQDSLKKYKCKHCKKKHINLVEN